MSTSSGNRKLVEALAEEFLERKRRGEPASAEEYAKRYPDLAAEILALFPALLSREDRGAPSGDRTASIAESELAVPSLPLGHLGEFRLLREVGRGGMGIVYEAEQESLGRRVALKVLPAGALSDDKQVRRFEREARAAARLHHAHIVPVFGVGECEGTHYYFMQFIHGQGLDAVLVELRNLREARSPESARTSQWGRSAKNRGARDVALSMVTGRFATVVAEPASSPIPATIAGSHESLATGSSPLCADRSTSGTWSASTTFTETDRRFAEAVTRIGVQVADALAYAHGQGILHRDIKPSNLLLDEDGNVWVADFGLAKATSGEDLTHTGDIVGTLRYMAPERFRGAGDARADVYALGLTLYELLALRPAFEYSDRATLIQKVTQELPPRLRKLNRKVPSDLETIIHKAIEHEPDQRYASAAALREDLQRFLDGEPIVARPVPLWERAWKWAKRRPAAAALVVVLHAAAAALLVTFFISYVQIHQALTEATDEKIKALSARNEEAVARRRADEARVKADQARNAALAETYRASLSEVRAMRAGHLPGWRDDALRNLARLATMPTPRRDLVELRNEAVASLGEFDIVEVARFAGSRGSAWALDFSPDSKVLATAPFGGGIDLWDIRNRRHVAAIVDQAARPSALGYPAAGEPRPGVKFLGDGTLACITFDHRVTFLDASGERASRPPLDGGSAQALGLAVDGCGRFIAVSWSDERAELCDVATGARRFFPSHGFADLALSSDGRWLALLGPGGTIDLVSTGKDGARRTLAHSSPGSGSLAFSPDGRVLGAKTVYSATLWDIAGHEEPLILRGHKDYVTNLAFSADGGWVATTSNDHTTRVWDTHTGQTLAVLPGPWFMNGVAFSPDGEFLATSSISVDNRVSLYRLQGRREWRRLVGHAIGLDAVAFDPDSRRIASGSGDCTIIVWDKDSGRARKQWRTGETYVTALAFTPDGSLLASGNGPSAASLPIHDYPIQLWDPESGTRHKVLAGQTSGISALAFDRSGRRVVAGANDGRLIVWDVASARVLHSETIGSAPIGSVAFLDESRLVTSVVQQCIALIDLSGKEPIRRAALPHGWGRFVVDGRRNRLIVGGRDGALTSFSLPDLAPRQGRPNAHDGIVWSLALSEGGRLLATGGEDRRVVLRDPETFEPLLTFPEWTGVVKELAFDRSGATLAFVGTDSDVAVWDFSRLHDGLSSLGLAWDQLPPATIADAGHASQADRLSRAIPVIRPGNTDPVAYAVARGLVQAGARELENGRFDEAIRDLEQARDRLKTLIRAAPLDSRMASQLGITLGCLGDAFKAKQQADEARVSFEEARHVLENMLHPSSVDLYNLACAYACLSTLADSAASPPLSAGCEDLANRAMAALRRALASGMTDYALIDRDHDLDPLRERPDFRCLILDRGFPSNPFAGKALAGTEPVRPTPALRPGAAAAAPASYGGIGIWTEPTPDGVRIKNIVQGSPAERDGRLKPGDTVVGIEQETLFAGKSPSEMSSFLRGEVGTAVRVIVHPKDSDRREVYELTRGLIATVPPSPAEALDRAIAEAPENPALRFERGELFARHGAHKAALADFKKALKRDPSDTANWMKATTLCLQIGDDEGYRSLARAMQERFAGTTDPITAERTAKIGLLCPPPKKDLAALNALATLAVTQGADSPLLPWFQLARGMAAYRDGHFQSAAEWLQKVEDSSGSTVECKITAVLFLAMTDARLGTDAQARALLDLGRRSLESSTPPANDLGEGWHDRLICRIALCEAEAVVLYDSGFPAEPFAR